MNLTSELLRGAGEVPSIWTGDASVVNQPRRKWEIILKSYEL